MATTTEARNLKVERLETRFASPLRISGYIFDAMPSVLLPRKGTFGLVDYEKMFSPDPKAGDIFDLRGVNRETGCIVVVRPDQYVAHVLPLHGHEALAEFFACILVDAR